MGNRRIGRKRLYGVEKQGQSVDLEAGAGISGAIARATQHRQGQELITEILIDLGTSTQDIEGGGTNAFTIGVNGGGVAGHITQLTVAKYGIITEIRAVVLETATQHDLDLVTGDAAVNVKAAVTGNRTVIIDDMGEKGADQSALPAAFHANMQDGTEAYLYICNGASEASAADQDAGKYAIYIHGFAAPADL